MRNSTSIKKEDFVLVHKTVRLERSFVEDIEEESKRKNQDFSKTLRKRYHNSEYFSPKDKQLWRKVFKDYDLKEPTFKDNLMAFANIAHNHNGIGNNGVDSETEEEEKRFDCNGLCKKCRGCTSNAMFELGEIKALNCYVSKFPYEYKGHRVCKFMFFLRDFPHDPENPYPTCKAKQKDVPLQLPKDRVIRDPQFCWTCYMMRKKQREQKEREKQEAIQLRKTRAYNSYRPATFNPYTQDWR